MVQTVTEAAKYANMTGTTTITGPLWLTGVFCASSTSGTVQISDGATAVTGTFTVEAGTFYPLPAYLATSAVVTIANTANITVHYTQ